MITTKEAEFPWAYGKTSPELVGLLTCEKCSCSWQSETDQRVKEWLFS